MLATTPTGRAMRFARLRDRATQRCGSYRTSRVLQLLLALLLTSLAGILVAQPAPSMASVGGATPTGHIYDVQGAPPVSSDATTERGSPTACSPHRIHEAGEPRPYGPSARSWRAEGTAANTYDDPAPLVRAARPAATSGTLVRSASTGHVAFSGAGVAAKSTTGAVEEAFHYTDAKWLDSMMEGGLRPGTYATPEGGLSPLQAKLDLALPPNRALPNAVVRIDVSGLRSSGYEIPQVSRVSSTVTGPGGRVYTMPGGGTEMQFPYAIPSQFLKGMP